MKDLETKGKTTEENTANQTESANQTEKTTLENSPVETTEVVNNEEEVKAQDTTIVEEVVPEDKPEKVKEADTISVEKKTDKAKESEPTLVVEDKVVTEEKPEEVKEPDTTVVEKEVTEVIEDKVVTEEKPERVKETNTTSVEKKTDKAKESEPTLVEEDKIISEEKPEEVKEPETTVVEKEVTEVIEDKVVTEEKPERVKETNTTSVEKKTDKAKESEPTLVEEDKVVTEKKTDKAKESEPTLVEEDKVVTEEKPEEIKKPEPTLIEEDFSKLSKEELVNNLSDKLDNISVSELRNTVDHIKAVFYKNHKLEIEELRKAFIAEGGIPEEFVIEEDAVEEKFKVLLNKFKSLKAEFNKNLELEKESNLKKKYQVIEEIKALINGKESLNKTFNEFHELQNTWREIGLVPQSDVKNMWETYHHCIEQFYDYVKINRELRDLDFKRNLDAKILICEKADQLLIEPSVVKAFKSLQKLHDDWKEVGPVLNEKREEIWERFKETTSKINKTHQDYFESLKEEQANNLIAKTALSEKSEELANESINSHKDWENKSNEIIELQKLWKTIGFATKKDNNKVYERFRAACDLFFTNKREFYKASKGVQNDNMQMKTELCLQAEALKGSSDWKKTSEELIRLQKKWKEVGPVPRKLSDQIWKRFRAACNEFFDRKGNYFSNIDQEYDDNLKRKRELIDKAKNFEHKEDVGENLNGLSEIQKEWTLIGHVPYKMKDSIQKEFRDAINAQFDSLKIDSVKRQAFVYKQRIDNIADSSNSKRSIRFEKDKVLERIRQLENDINILDNNIGFFAKTKGAEGLINDVNKKIENAKTQIKVEKQKLDMLRKAEN